MHFLYSLAWPPFMPPSRAQGYFCDHTYVGYDQVKAAITAAKEEVR